VKITIRKILCPVDFSENSEHALDYAIAFAEANKARLQILHVMEPPVYAMPSYPVVSDFAVEAVREFRKSCEDRLQELTERVRERYPDIESSLVTGTPFIEIIATAKEEDVDLLVLGTHGRTGLAHMLVGSVAEKIVRKAPCPVLTVRHPEHEFVMP